MRPDPGERGGGDDPPAFLLIGGFADSLVRFRGHLVRAVRDQGFAVHVAAPGLLEAPDLMAELRDMGVQPHSIPLTRTGTNPAHDVRTLLALSSLIRRLRPEVVLAYTVKPVIYGSLAGRLRRVPRRYALITGRGTAFLPTPEAGGASRVLGRVVRGLYSLGLRDLDCVVFQNPDDEAFFRARGMLRPGARTAVVNGSGVDLTEFASLPVPEGQPHFLMIARLLGAKGVREYASAARSIRSEYPDATFSLAGWLDESPDSVAQTELDDWIESGAIRYLGRLSDVRPALAESTVFVLPSYGEGTPRTVLEAMGTGRAIITTSAPGCKETVSEGVNGFLVTPASSTALEVAIRRFIDDPTLAVRMGASSRRLVEEKYDVVGVTATMLGIMGIV